MPCSQGHTSRFFACDCIQEMPHASPHLHLVLVGRSRWRKQGSPHQDHLSIWSDLEPFSTLPPRPGHDYGGPGSMTASQGPRRRGPRICSSDIYSLRLRDFEPAASSSENQAYEHSHISESVPKLAYLLGFTHNPDSGSPGVETQAFASSKHILNSLLQATWASFFRGSSPPSVYLRRS